MALMTHIVEAHHVYCRAEVSRLAPLMKQVVAAHARIHPELRHMERLLAQHNRELLRHLVKEEQTLFPLIARMEVARERETPLPRPSYGTIEHPVRVMMTEHVQSGRELQEIRQLSAGYTPPADADDDYRTLLTGLRAFEADMLEHSSLEDEYLFPRAQALEAVVYGE